MKAKECFLRGSEGEICSYLYKLIYCDQENTIIYVTNIKRANERGRKVQYEEGLIERLIYLYKINLKNG